MIYRKIVMFGVICAVFSGGISAVSGRLPEASESVNNGVPIARIKESIICCPGETVVLDGWASIDIGGEVVKWYWDITGNSEADTVTDRGELAFNAPKKSGLLTVSLLVQDRDGNISEPVSAMIHVMNSAPKVTVGPDTTIKAGVRLSFNPGIEYYCSEPVLFEWDFDDDGKADYRSQSNGVTSKVYYKPGKYYARFTVTDSFGRIVGARQTIHVTHDHPR